MLISWLFNRQPHVTITTDLLIANGFQFWSLHDYTYVEYRKTEDGVTIVLEFDRFYREEGSAVKVTMRSIASKPIIDARIYHAEQLKALMSVYGLKFNINKKRNV